MICKVYGYPAYVGTHSELYKHIVLPQPPGKYYYWQILPIFDCRPRIISNPHDDDIVLVIFTSEWKIPNYDLDFIQKVNEAWDRYYKNLNT